MKEDYLLHPVFDDAGEGFDVELVAVRKNPEDGRCVVDTGIGVDDDR